MKLDIERLTEWCILNLESFTSEDYNPADIINGYQGDARMKNGKTIKYSEIRYMFRIEEK